MKKKKTLLALASTLLLASTLTPAVSAATSKTKKKLDAYYAGVNIFYNNNQIPTTIQPFIVDDRTYIPLSMVAQALGKDVEFNPSTFRIDLTDKPDVTLTTLQTQLAQKSAELKTKEDKIAELEAKIKSLESKIKEEENKKVSLDDLENKLNDDYDSYNDTKLEISLSGDEDDITVKIEVDLDRYEDEWKDWSVREKEDYLQDIVDDILKEFSNADISGNIKDGSKELLTFDVNSKDEIEIEENVIDIADLQSQVRDDYEGYWSTIDLRINVSGDEDDTDFKVYVDYSQFKSKWDNLSDSEIQRFAKGIYEDIEDKYPDSNIDGIIYDSRTERALATYDKTSNGNYRFSRTAAYSVSINQ